MSEPYTAINALKRLFKVKKSQPSHDGDVDDTDGCTWYCDKVLGIQDFLT